MLTIETAWRDFNALRGWDAFEQATGFTRTNAVFMAVVGSVSHGTHDPQPDSIDDVDLFAVVIPPMHKLIGLETWEHWNGWIDRYDVVVHSLRKYVGLLLKGNPNMLSTLYLNEDHFDCTATFRQLVENRHRFVSKQAFKAFNGYAVDQHNRLRLGVKSGYMGEKRKALFNQFGFDPKMASHTLRLWTMATEFASTGTLQVQRIVDAEHLKAVKRGDVSLPIILQELAELQHRAEQAEAASTLPEHPDSDWAVNWLMTTTYHHLNKAWHETKLAV